MTAGPLLITGGTGLLGVNWAVACREHYSVTLTLHERPIQLSGVHTCQVDLTDAAALCTFFAERQIENVIHTAGFTSVEGCERDPEAAHHCNVALAETVARAAADTGVGLIHVSTDHLFDGKADIYFEDSAVSPVNVYGRTKAMAEETVLRAHPGAIVLRTNFYGWGPSYRPSFSDWLLNALRADRPLRLFTDMRYTPTNITPLVEAAMALSAQGASGIFHAVGDEALSKYEFGLRLAESFGLSPKLIEPVRLADQPELVRRPRSMALGTRRLRHFLGQGLGGTAGHLDLLRTQEHTAAITEVRHL